MTITQAEQFIRAYQEILADESKRGSRRDPSVLPAPKEWVLKAIKLEMAQLFLLNSHTNESVTRPLINAAMFLDSFSELPFEPSEFIESMHRRRREIDSFYVELLKLDRALSATPLIVCSADERELRDRRTYLESKGCLLLPKPFILADLLQTLAQALEGIA